MLDVAKIREILKFGENTFYWEKVRYSTSETDMHLQTRNSMLHFLNSFRWVENRMEEYFGTQSVEKNVENRKMKSINISVVKKKRLDTRTAICRLTIRSRIHFALSISEFCYFCYWTRVWKFRLSILFIQMIFSTDLAITMWQLASSLL